MSRLDLLNGKKKAHVTKDEYKSNFASQLQKTSHTVTQLQEFGVGDDSLLKLEFFFYTNTYEKASSLAVALESEGYLVDYGTPAGEKNSLVITGWTVPMRMTTLNIQVWAEQMCSIGYEHDCEFDGWGTTIEQ